MDQAITRAAGATPSTMPPAAAPRSWAILLTSPNHGIVRPLGHPFKDAGEHHERVVVVEVPAAAGAPSDQVNLVLRAPLAEARIYDIAAASELGIGADEDEMAKRTAFARAIEREVAAQVGQVAVPEGFVMMPRRLTAENGAKSLLLGEFKESIQMPCPECDGEGDDECLTCENMGEVSRDIPVSWDNIKAIYEMAVEHLAAPSPAKESK